MMNHSPELKNDRENEFAGFCVVCGNKLKQGWKFCSHCGSAVKQKSEDSREIVKEHVLGKCPICKNKITDRDLMRIYLDGPHGWYEKYLFQCEKCGRRHERNALETDNADE